MNKRLMFLEQHVASGAADSFAHYGLAMEYRKEGRTDDAVAAFTRLKDKDPDYLPLYLMAGQTLIDAGRSSEAKSWLENGVSVARRKGDTKTLGELESALSTL